jgi:hypothetical protein
MSLTLTFYTQMKYDGKKMYDFFINFVNSYVRYVHDEPMYIRYISLNEIMCVSHQYYFVVRPKARFTKSKQKKQSLCWGSQLT